MTEKVSAIMPTTTADIADNMPKIVAAALVSPLALSNAVNSHIDIPMSIIVMIHKAFAALRTIRVLRLGVVVSMY